MLRAIIDKILHPGKNVDNLQQSIRLYCDNPLCGRPIDSDPVFYSEPDGQIYHDLQCSGYAGAIPLLQTQEPYYLAIREITLPEAYKLYQAGEIAQSELEELAHAITLSCDNPQCDLPIEHGPVLYNPQDREIYHDIDCAILAGAHKSLATPISLQGRPGVPHSRRNTMVYITLLNAYKLHQAGQLVQFTAREGKPDSV
jgi:hypothetical protein